MSRSSPYVFDGYQKAGLLLVLGPVIFLSFMYSRTMPRKSEVPGGEKIARLAIEVGGNKREFEGEVIEGMTMLEALQAAAEAGEMDIGIEGGAFVLLSGNTESKKLTFYLNDKRIDGGNVKQTVISPGDFINIKSE